MERCSVISISTSLDWKFTAGGGHADVTLAHLTDITALTPASAARGAIKSKINGGGGGEDRTTSDLAAFCET